MSADGAVMFARYAYPPNALGYCGPAGASALLQAESVADIALRAQQFEGAWCYLEFIAEATGLADPLDPRVVEAYWIGNDLLDEVDPTALVTFLEDRFSGQLGGTWREASTRATAHHSFQVFEVYPWANLLKSRGNPTAVTVLDQCRIRTGTVVEVHGESAIVESQPIVWDGSQLGLGPVHQQLVRWSIDGSSLLAGVSVGDLVSLHWDWVCEVLRSDQAMRIEVMEARQRQTLEQLVDIH